MEPFILIFYFIFILLQEYVRQIKETLCYCALDPAEEDAKTGLDATYTLPDGKVLKDGLTKYALFSVYFIHHITV